VKPATSKLGVFAGIVYACLFLLLSAWAVIQPQYTWDLVGYIGCSVGTTDARAIHRAAFDAIRTIPSSSSKEIQLDSPYRVDVAANPFHFAEQLPFYSIKPVYVALVKDLHHLGLAYPKAAASISGASNFLLALLLWYWLSTYLNGLALFGACSLIMLSPNILELSRWTTPDSLSTLVAAIGLYLILERGRYFWGCAFLVINVWVRTDALVLAGIVLLVLLLRGKLDVAQFGSLSLLALASYFTINHFGGSYGWRALFYNSFLGGVTAPGETAIHLSFSTYLHQVVRGAYLWLIAGSFALYGLLGGLTIWLGPSSMYSYMVAAVLSARAVSYALYPNGDQRYTAVLYVIVPVALVIAVSSERFRRSTQGQPEPEKSMEERLPVQALESAAVSKL
jgi:hypothetical protein